MLNSQINAFKAKLIFNNPNQRQNVWILLAGMCSKYESMHL